MIDHMGFRVRDLAAARRFYEACAAAIDLQVMDNTSESFLIVRSTEKYLPFIWVGTAQPAFWSAIHATSASPIHLGFKVRDRAAVDRFIAPRLPPAESTTVRRVCADPPR
jgi:catechol 2,3-dioxygenase-like lactoylglutathione lyase family enzyme